MKLANIMLAIGGGRDNTLPKYNVTAGEIAVLRAIHGEDAVFDVEPLAGVAEEDGRPRTNRQELARLRGIYGGAKDGNGVPFVESLYPGAAARVFEGFDELDLPEEFFKPVSRANATAVAAEAEDRPKSKAELIAYAKTRGIEVDAKATAKQIAATLAAAEMPPAGEDEDDVDDIDDADGTLFK